MSVLQSVCPFGRRWFHHSAMLLASVLATAGLGVPAAAETIVDDEQMARGFAAGLGRLVDAAAAAGAEIPVLPPLSTDAARMQLQAGAGCTVPLPAAETLCTLTPERSLYETVTPAIVVVGSVFKCDRCKDWHLGQTASGWILSADGLVVTNHHVLDRPGGNHYGVMTSDGQVYAITGIVAADAVGDAAVLQINTRGRRLPTLAIGRPADCGEQVTIISHPKGRFYSLTTGVVSRYHRQRQPGAAKAGPKPSAVWMSVTADYAVGSSGGPVLNAAGEVVGMVSRTVSVQAGPNPSGAPPAAVAAAGAGSASPAGPAGAAGAPGAAAANGQTVPGAQPQVPVGGSDKPPRPVLGHEQMVFKDCVSADTLLSLMSH